MMSARRIPVAYPDAAVPIVAGTTVGSAERATFAYHLHTDVDWEITYITTGRARMWVAGAQHSMRAGQALIIRPDQPHAFASWSGKHQTLIFRQGFLHDMPFRARGGTSLGLEVAGKRLAPRLTVTCQRRPVVEHALERIEQESFGNEPTKRAMCCALLAQFLLELARNARELDPSAETHVSPLARRTVEQLCAEVQAELDYPWTLKEMVRRSGYSATQLRFLFDRVTSLSPCRWLCRERVRRAREILAQSDKSVTEVAVAVGFGSRSQFYRAFHDVMRISPNRYRAIVRHPE